MYKKLATYEAKNTQMYFEMIEIRNMDNSVKKYQIIQYDLVTGNATEIKDFDSDAYDTAASYYKGAIDETR